MKNKSLLVFMILIILFFTMSSDAILSIKIRELQIQLSRYQTMNYEFSNQALRKKFQSLLYESNDVMDEVRNNSMDSYVLNQKINQEENDFKPNEILGLYIVNIIRKFTFKKNLKIENDQFNLLKIQMGFYFERNLRYKQAIGIYDELESSQSMMDPEEFAFILLHNAYCKAMVGNREHAIAKLYLLINEQSASHFTESAQILLDILLELNKKAGKIKGNNSSPEEIVKSYYNSGLYSSVVEKLSVKKDLNNNEKFMYARSSEKTGDIQVATEKYLELASQKSDLEIAKKANRRILLLGTVYEGDKKLVKIAESNAVVLKDTEVVKDVKIISENKKNTVVLENYSNLIKNKSVESIEKDFKEVKEIKIDIEQQVEKSISPSEKKVEKELVVLIKEKIPDYESIIVNLTDGRIYKGKEFKRKDSLFLLVTKNFNISLDPKKIKSIEGNNKNINNNKKNQLLITTLHKDSYKAKSLIFQSESVILNIDGNEIELSLTEIQKILFF